MKITLKSLDERIKKLEGLTQVSSCAPIECTLPTGYIKDPGSGLVWGPEAPNKMNWEDAKNYAASLNDLGLKWSLPSIEEFLDAFGNKERVENKKVLEAIPDMKGKWFWSRSPNADNDYYAWGFSGYYGEVYNYFRINYYGTVRCVGR